MICNVCVSFVNVFLWENVIQVGSDSGLVRIDIKHLGCLRMPDLRLIFTDTYMYHNVKVRKGSLSKPSKTYIGKLSTFLHSTIFIQVAGLKLTTLL